ncbi:FKBP-type peptidyl-prolyl cis-trans isomerase [Deinococcus cellulosilyticus]|uniref:Peptidyl-prolyl cis-trans isomerase n=1 Tax=Deinococcus cellulosilyticus (strain DSM 18568 / NBRC 106333 / KACC 11606 / 5516J-15) TaxID=1223518 RepID=A0A511NBY5_DEIC1|nr:hypothetical protein DC3_57110 [Deinococcus cellulosilyticus NBRC 106333 = KACC 11606]
MSELKIEKLHEGTGPQVQKGQTVSVHYTGKFEDGRKFDSSVDRGEPLVFPVGVGHVIAGWDQGLLQLNVGDKAILTIPGDLAYGRHGIPGVIPPNATLIFEVEVLGAR